MTLLRFIVPRALLAVAVLAAAFGCGRRVTVVPVEGQVLLDGRPLAGGSIMLQPTAGPAARGRLDAEGRFRMGTYRPGDGVIPGLAAVRVASFEETTAGPDEEPARGRSRIPERYNDFLTSRVTVEVVAGMGPVTIELTSP